MAGSRLEKVGTIFTRVTGLLRAGAVKEEDKPIWYDIYKAFPPKYEPRYDRTAPDIPIKNIFYPEDEIRSKFHKLYKNIGSVNLSDRRYQSQCQRFISIYNTLKNEGNTPEDQLFDRAVEIFNVKNISFQNRNIESTLVSKFQEAQQTQRTEDKVGPTIDIKNIFKE